MAKTGHRKHIPRRVCVACRNVESKRELIRIVRTPEGKVVVDERGKMNGRGAYLCSSHSCWDAALKTGRLGYALKVQLNEDVQEILRTYAERLPEGELGTH
jgi:predicted RNA-binding protein YlxR (DUF448 family)